MEFLLNVVWVTLALLGLASFVGRRQRCGWTARVPYPKALLAIGCMLVLLFPVVSASDDLHPTQALLEDASKRIHQLAAPLEQAPENSAAGLLAVLLAILISSLLILEWRRLEESPVRAIARARTPLSGRAPPTV